MIEDIYTAQQLGEAGCESVRTRFTVQQMLEKTQAIYEELLSPACSSRVTCLKRLALVVLILLTCLTQVAAAGTPRKTFVLITLTGVSLDQLIHWDIPAFRALLDHGAIGAMTNKTDKLQTFDDVAVTIGAGTHARGDRYLSDNRPIAYYARDGFNAREPVNGVPADVLFKRLTGITVPATAVVQTAMPSLREINRVQRYPIIPGMLGEQLRRAGVHYGGVRQLGLRRPSLARRGHHRHESGWLGAVRRCGRGYAQRGCHPPLRRAHELCRPANANRRAPRRRSMYRDRSR